LLGSIEMTQTKIEWADMVWNPITGCSRAGSPGCDHCYAKRMAYRLKGRYGYPKDDPFKVTFHPDRLDEPFHWKKPRRVFVCSMGDLFHEDVERQWVDRIFAVVSLCQQHTFQVLTKRPERMRDYCADPQTPFRVAKAGDAILVDAEIRKTPYEIRPIPKLDNYFADNTGQIFTGHGSGHCVWCGNVFDNGQQDSIFCTQKCRSASHYAKTQGRNPEPASRIMRLVTVDVGEEGHTRVRIIGGNRELVHRLVLRTFDREPKDDEQSCHRDGNPTRNHICNLRWGTQEDNWEDRIRHGKGQSWKSPNTSIPIPIEWPLSNCFMGVSVENQKTADERIPILLQIPAAKRFISFEPLLEGIGEVDFNGIHWAIIGGETGPNARPMEYDWAFSLSEQCEDAGIPFFYKYGPNDEGKVCKMPRLKGIVWDQIPDGN